MRCLGIAAGSVSRALVACLFLISLACSKDKGGPTQPSNPAPFIASLNPFAVDAGSAGFTLVVTGSGFVRNSIVRWNGTDKATTYVSATELRTDVGAQEVTSSGAGSVTVINPAPGGGTSPAAVLQIRPRQGLLVFASFRTGNWEIFSMKPDGSAVTNLTNSPAKEEWAELSRDRTRVAFVSDRAGSEQLYVMNADGSGVTAVPGTVNGYQPSFSPDGSLIAYGCDRRAFGNVTNICVIAPNGSGVRQLTTNSVAYPDWSPDGTKILHTCGAFGSKIELCVLSYPSGADQPLTNTPGPSSRSQAGSWSPDGTKIVYVVYDGSAPSPGRWDIWVMNANGTNQTRLTTAGHYYKDRPRFSPDGAEIVFTTGCDVVRGDYNVCEMRIMKADGTNERLLLSMSSLGRWR